MHSNLVDVHNELRQHFLALEEKCVTTNCWFQVFTSLVGITLTDCDLAFKDELHDGHEDKNITIKELANIAAHQMIHNKLTGASDVTMATRTSPPKPASRAIPELPQSVEYQHRLEPLGRKPQKADPTKDFGLQLTCVIRKWGKLGGVCFGTSTNKKDCFVRQIFYSFNLKGVFSSPEPNKRARTAPF
jgi:hypothetical protein